ncbi:MAG TPA: hypothetical protein VF902_09515 [Coriobacteriia bacterium]
MRGALYATFLAAGVLGIFVLPWYASFAVRPAVGDSYTLGFDNKVAIVGAVLAAAALFFTGVGATRGRSGGPGLWLARVPSDRRTNRAVVVVVGVLTALMAAALISAAWGQWQWDNDSQYFLDRMSYVLNGNVPFVDMEFSYGLGLLYLPIAAFRVMRYFGTAMDSAYWITYWAVQVLGVVIVAYVTDHLDLKRAAKAMTFLALAVPWALNGMMGLNYTMLRFMTPVAAVLFFHARLSKREGRRGAGPWLAMVLAVVLTLVCAFITPEAGIGVFMALTAYLGYLAVRRRGRWLIAVAAYAAIPVAYFATFGRAAFEQGIAMTGGAVNFPVVPGPPMLLLAAALFGGFTMLPGVMGRGPFAERPATLAIAAVAGVMVIPAFGRADIIHVFWNGLGVTVLALAVFATRRPRVFWTYALAFLLVSTWGTWLTFRHGQAGRFSEHMLSSGRLTAAEQQTVVDILGPPAGNGFEQYQPYAKEPVTYDDSVITSATPVAPFVMFRDPIGMRLAERGALASPYYRALAYTSDQLEIQKRYMENATYVLMTNDVVGLAYKQDGTPTTGEIPRSSSLYLDDGARKEVDAQSYGWALMYPSAYPYVRTPFEPGVALLEHIRPLFRPVGIVGPYTLLQRIGASGIPTATPAP